MREKIIRRIMLVLISAVFIASGATKLLTLRGTAESIYKWLLIQHHLFSEAYLIKIVIVAVSLTEVGLAILIQLPGKTGRYAVFSSSLFLLLMLVVNLYQWNDGFKNCACFGTVLTLTPDITLVKTSFLLLLSVFAVKSLPYSESNGS